MISFRYGLTLTTVCLIVPCFTSQWSELFGMFSALAMEQMVWLFSPGMSINVWSIPYVMKWSCFLPLLKKWHIWSPPKPLLVTGIMVLFPKSSNSFGRHLGDIFCFFLLVLLKERNQVKSLVVHEPWYFTNCSTLFSICQWGQSISSTVDKRQMCWLFHWRRPIAGMCWTVSLVFNI